MPRLVDHDRRRTELVEAVWRVVLRHGVAGASVRTVAKEAGLSVGSVRHFFADQDELLHVAMREVARRAGTRIAADEDVRRRLAERGEPVEAVARLLEQAMPLTTDQATEARIWFAFLTHDAADPAVDDVRRELDEDLRGLCERSVAALAEAGALGGGRDTAVETTLLWALVDGLTLRILLDPATTPPDAARTALRAHLRQLAQPAVPSGAAGDP